MTWTKLGEEFPDEARDLTDAEFRTHVEALCWSNRRRLDLLIPKRELPRFAEAGDPQAAAAGLVAKDWWDDLGLAWYIGRRFPAWQLESAVVAKKRADATLRQRRRRQHLAGIHELCLPGHCPNVTRDSPRDGTRDPVRNGSDRSTKTEGLVLAPAEPFPAPESGAGSSGGGAGAQHDSNRGTGSRQHDDPSVRQLGVEGRRRAPTSTKPRCNRCMVEGHDAEHCPN